jgi:hypothetical protein
MKATASFSGVSGWTDILHFHIDRQENESRKAFAVRQGETARQGFAVLAGVEPNVVIVTEETFSL